MITFQNHNEGEEFPKGLAVGILYTNGGTKFRGIYIKWVLPKVEIRDYICGETFNPKTGPCKKHCLFRIDKVRNKWRYLKAQFYTMWAPEI